MGIGRTSIVVASGVGALVMFLASTPHDDAISNVAGWLELIGFSRLPQFIEAPTADFWLWWGGLFLLVFAIVSGLRLYFLAPFGPTAHLAADQELGQLRRDIGRLAELITNHDNISVQIDDIAERLRRLDGSDHEIWSADPARQLRRDFVNRVGVAADNGKRFASVDERNAVMAEINDLAGRLREVLSGRRSVEGAMS